MDRENWMGQKWHLVSTEKFEQNSNVGPSLTKWSNTVRFGLQLLHFVIQVILQFYKDTYTSAVYPKYRAKY